MRCTGHCCKNFPLPYSYNALKKAYEAWRNGSANFTYHGESHDIPQDIFLIYPMVVALGDKRYNCKNLLEDGNCSIYENRPRVCSEYPYGEKCTKEGCTLI